MFELVEKHFEILSNRPETQHSGWLEMELLYSKGHRYDKDRVDFLLS